MRKTDCKPSPRRPPPGRYVRFSGGAGRRPAPDRGLIYDPAFVGAADRAEILRWLARLEPLWEERYSTHRPPPAGQPRRRLLRPVYWLGNWQFACLDYYRPPKGVRDRCVRAEPFPAVLARLVARAEDTARRVFGPPDLPSGWRLNTCLVNFYGSRLENGKRIDTARVGEHKDFEPGPVASISLGERALFQFVSSRKPGQRDAPVAQQWLDDGSLQVFGGDYWKKRVFHRVQRVDKRAGHRFSPEIPGFESRRINFTFRYVPDEHVVPFDRLSPEARADVLHYVQELGRRSPFWRSQLVASGVLP